jgi:hypothetical protein
MSTQKVDTPFFYLLGDLAKAAARVKVAGAQNAPLKTIPTPSNAISNVKPLASPDPMATANFDNLAPSIVEQIQTAQQTQPFKGGPGLDGLGRFPAAKPSLLSQLGQFATSPMGLGAGLGLTSGAVGAYLGSRRRKDEDEKEASVIKSLAKYAAEQVAEKRKVKANKIVNMDSISGNLADYLTPFSWGGERAGRSQAMADAAGDSADFNVRHPGSTYALFSLGGGALGGALGGPAGAGVGSVGGALLSGLMRRQEMQRINDLYDKSLADDKLKPKHPEFSRLSAALLPLRGPHRTGQLETSQLMSGERGPGDRGKDTARDLLYGLDNIVPGARFLHGYTQNIKTQAASPSTSSKEKEKQQP